jgi:hypothetical protein
VDPTLKAKAIEICLRYKGTWCVEIIEPAPDDDLPTNDPREHARPTGRGGNRAKFKKTPRFLLLQIKQKAGAAFLNFKRRKKGSAFGKTSDNRAYVYY